MMFAYPPGLPVHYCSHGHPVILPMEVVRVDGKVYCLEHAPKPEPSEAIPETREWEMTPRQQRAVAFQRWRYEHGAFCGDDHAEPLTDAEVDRLSRHVLP